MIAGRDPRRLAILVVAIVLAGLVAFGLWHLVVGGLLSGNLRAGGFGVVLAVAAGGLLRVAIDLDRRARRG